MQTGQADAAILPVVIGQYLMDKHHLEALQQAHVLPGEESSMRFAATSETLKDVVNLSLGAATAERMADIRSRALTLPGPPPGVPLASIAWGALMASGVVLAAFAVMRRRAGLRLRDEVTQRQAAVEATRRSEERFAVTFEHAAVGIAQVSPDGSWLKANRQLCSMLGYTEAELLKMTFQQLTHPDDLAADLQLLERLVAGDIPFYALEKRYLRKDGDTLWGLLTVSLVRGEDDQPAYFVSVVEDITQRKTDEARIQFLAFHDDLTQLPNRALMADRAASSIAQARRSGAQVALLYLDLDHFKEVNDSLGHSVGDQLLVAVTERLTSGLRASDSLGRHGGDEFLVLLPELPRGGVIQAASATANKLLDLLRQPFYVDDHEIAVNTSIGIALYPDDGQDFETLLRKADTSLYAAKGAGRGLYRFFAEEMNRATADYESIRNGIRYAL